MVNIGLMTDSLRAVLKPRLFPPVNRANDPTGAFFEAQRGASVGAVARNSKVNMDDSARMAPTATKGAPCRNVCPRCD